MKKSQRIHFVKMQGAGNDFIVIDHQLGLDYAAFAKKACDRHMGIGADGVLVLDESTAAEHRMRIINADGSEAEMCGNGARCMAVYIARKFAVLPEVFGIETLAGVIRATVDGETAAVKLSDPKEYRPNIEIKIGDQKLSGHFINTGVPHTIVFVEGLSEFDVNGLGRVIRQHKVFAPKGTNVNFVQKIKEGYVELRTYERGVEAETLACGTGSVAAALVGYLQGFKELKPAQDANIKVVTKSGEILDVTFDLEVKDAKPVITNVWLKGSGKFICKGEYYYGI
ncbi:MAG: diaminopimelate epimerase [Candidatus Omnitrophica bacterium]|nr:diaminopimelate epimerase [Candidatus Omnitrophota bacterium]